MLTRQQRKTLTNAVARRLPSNPSIAVVEPFVGRTIAQEIPAGTVLQVAQWIIDSALAQATPEMFIGIVFRVDVNRTQMQPLVDLAQALQNDPGSWQSTVSPGPDGDPAPADRPLWKQPAVVGPVVAALLGLAGVMIAKFGQEPDKTPPPPPELADPREVADDDDGPRLEIEYAGATDEVGLQEVRLWYRFSRQGKWSPTDEAWKRDSGIFDFAMLDASGVYYFDAISTDTSGNTSPHPAKTDSNGQCKHSYVRPEDKNVLATVIEILAETGDDLAPRLEAYISKNQALIEAEPSVATQFQSALQRSAELATTGLRTKPPARPLPGLSAMSLERLASIEIPVRFNVIHDGTTGIVTAARIQDQLRVLNEAFAPGGIGFRLEDTRWTENAAWARMGYSSRAEREAKAALQADPESTLNVYVVDPQGGFLEWSYFPEVKAAQPEVDGTVVSHSTLPGTESPFNSGQTLIHSVGHWLGLLHTFQGGCTGPGDHVDDTVAHASPNFGKPPEGERNNACNPEEQAPIHNYMNFVDDGLADHFTPGQFRRMKESIVTYRSKLLGEG